MYLTAKCVIGKLAIFCVLCKWEEKKQSNEFDVIHRHKILFLNIQRRFRVFK